MFEYITELKNEIPAGRARWNKTKKRLEIHAGEVADIWIDETMFIGGVEFACVGCVGDDEYLSHVDYENENGDRLRIWADEL